MRSHIVGVTLVAALVTALVACEGTRAVTVADKAHLSEHEAQWAARTFHSYVYDYSETQLSTSYNVHITVVNDTVTTVIDTQTGQPPVVPRTWPSMDALFNEADFAVQNGNYSVSLEYNDQYGYLTLLSLTSNNPGGDFLARASSLQPSP
ncbi:MAG: DUF6174 domain-containing protein [Gemmatimonadaceae bacterium]